MISTLPLLLLLGLPVGSLLLLLALPTTRQRLFKGLTLGTVLLQGLCVAYLWAGSAAQGAGTQVQYVWMKLHLSHWGVLAVDFQLGVDGLNIGLLALAVVVLGASALASWRMDVYPKAYFALYLLLDALIMGSFLAMDFLLFYIFFEMSLLPVYFFIGLWGGEQRNRAAIQFFLYTLLGAIMVLLVLIGLSLSVYDPVATGLQAGMLSPGEVATPAQLATIRHMVQTQAIDPQSIVHTLSFTHLQDPQNLLPDTIFRIHDAPYINGQAVRLLAFAVLFIGFGIKMAVVPFHTWLPDAHVAAPTPISMVLAGVLLKLGGYGLLRTAYSIFPEGGLYYRSEIGALGVLSIIYAAMNATAMQDLKRMVAYASVAHMGFVLLGLASLSYEGIHGALYHMISHGLITVLLFGVVGVLNDRTGDRTIAHYQGLTSRMPCYATVSIIAFAIAMGIPGSSGFIGELLILLGVFQALGQALPIWLGCLATLGTLLNAIYWIWTIQRMFLGPFALRNTAHEAKLSDLTSLEYLILLPLIFLALLLGLFPHWLLDQTTAGASWLVTQTHTLGQSHLGEILP
ncbi:MAG: NADH-quinone oxidoreductase subunit M [Bacteroidota bacterium]